MTNAFQNSVIGKRVLLTFISDFVIIFGVLFLNFDPVRLYAFYYLEFVTLLFSFGIYNLLADRRLDPASILLSTIFMGSIIGFFFLAAINAILPNEVQAFNQIIHLFYPYYDVPIFLSGTISASVINVKEYLSFENDRVKAEFSYLLFYNLMLIPGLIFAAIYANKYNHNLKMNLIIALILIRNLIEYKRYKGIQRLTMLSEPKKDSR